MEASKRGWFLQIPRRTPRSCHMVPEEMLAVSPSAFQKPASSQTLARPKLRMPRLEADRMGYKIIFFLSGVAVFPQIHAHLKPQNMTLFGILSLEIVEIKFFWIRMISNPKALII